MQLETAVAIVTRIGYHLPEDPRFVNGRPVLHYTLEAESGIRPPVELHWRVHWYETAFSEALLGRSKPTPAGLRRAEPADELAALLLFFARDGFLGLRLAADIGAWRDANAAALADRALDPLISDHPLLREALVTSARVAQDLVGLPADRLTAETGVARRSALARRLANWSQSGDAGQTSANQTLVDGLLSPPGELRALLRRNVFPPEPVIAGWYSTTGEARAKTAFFQALHPVKLVLRYLRGLWAVRRGRWWASVPAGTDTLST